MVAVTAHRNPADFLAAAEGWLLEREDRHNLVLSLSYARVSTEPATDDALWATVRRDGEVVGCAIRTPPHKLLVTEMPVSAGPLVAARVAQAYDEIPAVLGPAAVAESIAVAWIERRGGRWRPGLEQGIYRLDSVVTPTDVPGGLRLARSEDFELAVEWAKGFARDAGVQFATSRASLTRWIENETLFIWTVDGEPVSIAVAQGRTPRGVRIGYVYTPPERRGRGYASACVAAVSQRMLDMGVDFCVLYTDLTNPTSNRIYQRIGYRLLEVVRDYDLVAEPTLG